VITINHLVNMLEDRIGKKARIIHQEIHPADVRTNQADVTRAGEILGWSPKVNLEEGVTRLVDWYMQERSWASQVETP
jgi:nucleoside-diphosphate-sugar epimerase